MEHLTKSRHSSPHIVLIGCPIIAVTGRPESPLATHATITLDIGNLDEACPHGLAPSTTTTVMLALGDALALTIQKMRQFSTEDYARFHPGGALGRKLMTCADAMRPLERIAFINPEASVAETMHAITHARCGSALIVDSDQHLLGIITDGDIRRALSQENKTTDILHGPVSAIATMPCSAIHHNKLLAEATRLCGERRISDLPVTDEKNILVGLIDLQDLAHRGFDI